MGKLQQLKSKMEKYLNDNKVEDYRFYFVLAFEEGKKGNVTERKKLLIKSLNQLKHTNPNDRNIVNIIDIMLENGNKEDFEEYLKDLDLQFNDPISLSTIYKRRMIAAYDNRNEEEAEENFEKVKQIYDELGIRTNHPLIFYLQFMRCSIIIKFKPDECSLSNEFKKNEKRFKYEQDYRLDDKVREYNMKIEANFEKHEVDIVSSRERIKEFLKPVKNIVLLGYTFLSFAGLLGENGDDQELIGNIEKSKEYWQESVEYFTKSREFYYKKYGENHNFTLWPDTLKAEALLKLKHYDEASRTIQKPKEKYPNILESGHERVIKTNEVYERIKNEIEKRKDSNNY